MTDAQIRYRQLVENARHNREQERLSQYQTDVQAESSRYATSTQAETSRYSTDVNAKTQTATNAVSAEATKYAAEVKAAGQRYASDQSKAASQYSADVNAATNAARLAFDKQTQLVRNSLDAKQLRLNQLRVQAQNEQTRAETQKIAQDIANSLENLKIRSEELGLAKEAATYNNALTNARKYAEQAKTVKTWLESAGMVYDGLSKFVKDVESSLAMSGLPND